jgi:hypothetical protein
MQHTMYMENMWRKTSVIELRALDLLAQEGLAEDFQAQEGLAEEFV